LACLKSETTAKNDSKFEKRGNFFVAIKVEPRFFIVLKVITFWAILFCPNLRRIYGKR